MELTVRRHLQKKRRHIWKTQLAKHLQAGHQTLAEF